MFGAQSRREKVTKDKKNDKASSQHRRPCKPFYAELQEEIMEEIRVSVIAMDLKRLRQTDTCLGGRVNELAVNCMWEGEEIKD